MDKIFVYLDLKSKLQFRLVCKNLNNYTKLHGWATIKKLNLNKELRVFSENFLEKFKSDEVRFNKFLSFLLERCGRYLVNLITPCLMFSVVNEIISHCNNFKSIETHFDNIEQVEILSAKCPNLKEVITYYFIQFIHSFISRLHFFSDSSILAS